MNFSKRLAANGLVLAAVLGAANNAWSQPKAQTQHPKLVLGIVVDQFRYDYLTRFRSEYTGGLKRLLEEGANFTNSNYSYAPTVTAAGHTAMLTGAPPSVTGIVGNEWWDRETNATVTSVSDPRTRLVGGNGAGSSPRRLLQSTIGDELKAVGRAGRLIGISIKDRAAILPAGHAADAAYWFDAPSGRFVTSSFYMSSLPAWLDDVNKGKPADKYAGMEWLKHKMPAAAGRALYDEVEATPYGNELVQMMALRALGAERLGTTAGKTDVMTVSYSSNDYVGHRYGPDSEEVHDMALRVDKLIGELLQAAEAQAGAGTVLAFLTADHGVAPIPEENVKRKMPGGRLDYEQIRTTLNLVLGAKYGGSHWIAYLSEAGIYLDLATVGAQRATLEEVEDAAAAALRALPHISRVYTRTQLLSGNVPADRMGTAVRNGYYAARSGNLFFVPEAYWMGAATGTTHGTPYDYDSHVPMLFWGSGIKAGRYNGQVSPTDIAPTMATLLEIETPSGSVGRVLSEMLK